MVLKKLPYKLTVCKVADIKEIDLNTEFYFIGRTDEEISLVCKTEDTPAATTERDDGWRGFRIEGVLDFSLIGILSKLSGILAENKIGILRTELSEILKNTLTVGNEMFAGNEQFNITTNLDENEKSDFGGRAVFGEIKKVFRPEFINRIDETVVFERLDKIAAEKIAKKYYGKLEKRLSAAGIKVNFPDAVFSNAVKNGFSPEKGARPLQRYIREAAEDPISEMLLSGTISSGDRIICEETDEGKLFFKKAESIMA
jgi:hypothetical protein